MTARDRMGADGALVYEDNPGFIGIGRGGRRQFVEAQDPDAGGKWRSAAYWARRDRGARLRAAQIATGDGHWTGDGEFVVTGEAGAPWIAELIGKHGSYSVYVNWECRCKPCKLAHEGYGSDYRAGIVGGGSR